MEDTIRRHDNLAPEALSPRTHHFPHVMGACGRQSTICMSTYVAQEGLLYPQPISNIFH